MAQGPVAQGLRGSRALWLKGFVAQRPVAQGPVAQRPVAKGPVDQGLCGSKALLLKGFVAQGPVAQGLFGSRACGSMAGGSEACGSSSLSECYQYLCYRISLLKSVIIPVILKYKYKTHISISVKQNVFTPF